MLGKSMLRGTMRDSVINSSKYFSKMFVPVRFQQQGMRDLVNPHLHQHLVHQHLVLPVFFNVTHSDGYIAIYHYGLNLHFPND